MKKFAFIISLVLLGTFLFAKKLKPNAAEEIKKADLAFSQLCQEKGMKASFLAYADENVIKLNNKEFAVRGKPSLEKWFGDEKEDFKLIWKPDFAEVSKSGDLGYTFGNWRLTLADGTQRYGNYMTIWKKQADGSWKYVMDGGNATPDNPDLWK